MPLLVNSVPNLAQGVSQQPDNLRFPGQCDEQVNAWATVVEGLVKRPPTNYTKKLQSTTTDVDKLFTHFVKRSEQNKYCVTVSLGGVGVINVGDGTSIPVATTSIASSYLSLGSSVTNPLADLRALTVADYTFLVNKKRVVEKSNDVSQKSQSPRGRASYVSYNGVVYICIESHTSTSSFDATKWKKVTDTTTSTQWAANLAYTSGDNEALVVVKLGDYEKAYSIYIDDNLVGTASSLATRHAVTHSSSGITDAPPATYISGPATPTSGSSHISSHAGLYADTELIAKDLKLCLDSYLTGDGIASVTAGSGGTGWFYGGSTGGYELIKLASTLRIYWKLQLKISQTVGTNTHTALAEVTVVKGEIQTDGIVINRAGTGFNSDIVTYPITTEFEVLKKVSSLDGKDVYWDWFTPSEDYAGYGTEPTLTYTFSNRAAFDIERNGSVIKIKSTDGPFKIRVEDGLADQALGVVHREVSSITDLPVKCYNNFRVKVIGDADIDQDDYYVRFSTKEKEEFGEGTWVETVGFFQDGSPTGLITGIDTLLKQDTMPVTLVPFFKNGDINNFRLQTPHDGLTVKQGATYYRLDKDHTAADSNKPGVGADWEDFWTEVSDTTQGYLDWEADVYYYGPTGDTSSVGWAARSAGDDFTNPFPSFVGKQIRDIFFFKNRLGILTDSNVVFSEADEYFNFFRTTTQQLLDSAVIDVGLSHTKVAILEHAVPFQEKLMLFSQGSQFVLRGADVLSPKTVAISPATEYDLSDGIQPVALGNYIYFPFKRNDFEGMYEYFVDNNTETFHSEEITQQVPKYITSDIQKMAGSQSENTIVMSTTADARTLFVYKYFWSNKEKIQSAWMKFTFGRDIRGFDFIDSNLHLITADSGGVHLEKLTLEDGITDAGLDYTLYLDSKVDGSTLTTSYDAASKTTTISGFEYDPVDVAIYTKTGNKVAFTKTTSTAGTVSGTLANYVTHSGTIYKCETTHTSPSSFVAVDTSVTPNVTYWTVSTDVSTAPDWVAGKFYNNDKYFVAGVPYNMLYRFSDQTLKQPTERGGRSASDYAFQTIRNGSLDYADTGHFTVEVTPKFRDKYTYAFNPDIVGANLTLNTFTPQSGHFRFPVQCQPNEAKIEVVSDSALPVKLLAAEFESMMIPRSRRYGA